MPRQPRTRNTIPGRAERRELLALLRDRAAGGDTLAAGLLVLAATVADVIKPTTTAAPPVRPEP